MISLFKNRLVGIDLRLGPPKKFQAAYANLRQLTCSTRVGLEECPHVGVEFGHRNLREIHAATEVATRIRFLWGLIQVR